MSWPGPRKPGELPAWAHQLPATACMCSREVAELFRFSSVPALHASVAGGAFPPADMYSGKLRRAQWRMSTVRAEHARRLSVAGAVPKL